MNPQNMRDMMKVEKWGGSLIHALSRLAPRFLLLLVMVLSQSQAGAASGEVGGQVRVIIREVPEHDIAVRARQWVDETIQPFDQDDSPTRREKIAEAILKVGRRSVVQHGDGFNVMFVFYDEIDRRFRSDKHLVIQRMVAEMLVLKGMYMRDKRDRRESVAIFEEFEWRFGQNDDPIIRALSAKALVEKGIAWLKIDNPSAAIAAYDEAVSRFGEDEFPAVRAQVAYALLQKAL
ncbi:MAG: hypothetical protein LBB76_01225, partial [Azoarcus sp.]|nr:hypothetical protein [Azoarcus sp.]